MLSKKNENYLKANYKILIPALLKEPESLPVNPILVQVLGRLLCDNDRGSKGEEHYGDKNSHGGFPQTLLNLHCGLLPWRSGFIWKELPAKVDPQIIEIDDRLRPRRKTNRFQLF